MAKVAIAAAFLMTVAYALYVATPSITALAADMVAFAALALRACLGTGVFAVGVVSVWWLRRQSDNRNRQQDGAFALREYHLEPWTVRLFNVLRGKPSPRVILDVNAMMTHAAMVYQGVHLAEPPAGWDRQLAYMGDIERTRRVEDAITGDSVLGNPFVNLQRGLGGVANAATGRMLAGAYDKPIKPQPATIEQYGSPAPMLDVPELLPTDAVEESTPAALVMGQAATGELVKWDLAQTPHLRFHGATRGSGKTNAIQTVAAAALNTGAHVVVMDRVQFKDWGDFDGRAELVDTSDPRTLAGAAMRVLTIYHNRTKILARAGKRDVSQMPKPMRRIVVVVSEFGAQCETARAEKVIGDVEYAFGQLLRLAGATGIHCVFEDQVVDKWPRGMSTNATPVIGRMPAYSGQACGYIGRGGVTTDTFAPYTFWFDGVMFKAPHMQPELVELLTDVPAPSQLVMLTPPYARGVERSAFGRSVEPQGEGVEAQNAPPPLDERTNEQPTPNAVDAGPTDLQAAVWEWRDKHPNGTQAELRRDFEARNIRIARGYASDLWHKWTPKQAGNPNRIDLSTDAGRVMFAQYAQDARLPSGDKLGVDVTGGAA
jgi:hypothetical protein